MDSVFSTNKYNIATMAPHASNDIMDILLSRESARIPPNVDISKFGKRRITTSIVTRMYEPGNKLSIMLMDATYVNHL